MRRAGAPVESPSQQLLKECMAASFPPRVEKTLCNFQSRLLRVNWSFRSKMRHYPCPSPWSCPWQPSSPLPACWGHRPGRTSLVPWSLLQSGLAGMQWNHSCSCRRYLSPGAPSGGLWLVGGRSTEAFLREGLKKNSESLTAIKPTRPLSLTALGFFCWGCLYW